MAADVASEWFVSVEVVGKLKSVIALSSHVREIELRCLVGCLWYVRRLWLNERDTLDPVGCH